MWTVTLKLLPVVVSQHLLGGMLIVAFLWWLQLLVSAKKPDPLNLPAQFAPWLKFGVVLIFCQIALGAWTSTNYAALSCPDFPYCQGTQWFPQWQFGHAFNLFNKIGLNYEGGLLPLAAKQTIQIVHRFGADCVVGFWFLLTAFAYKSEANYAMLKPLFVIMGLLMLQVALGVMNILLQLPVAVAICHNLCAALTLLSAISINHKFSASAVKLAVVEMVPG